MLSTATAHAAAVHFPIALLIFAALHDGWTRLRGQPRPSHAAALAGTAGALLAVATGWILADNVEDPLLERHRWLGVATLVLGVASLLAGRLKPGTLAAVPLWLAAVIALPTGWLGGEMAHGHDGGPTAAMLAASPMPRVRSQRVIALPPDASDDQVALQARRLLERACFKCHRAEKKKGGLRLDTRDHALAGGESGPAIAPFDQASLLLQRVKLDAADDDVMPRRGKLLSSSEIELLSTWIARGAPWPAASATQR
jgi:uncharacterized membrane protein